MAASDQGRIMPMQQFVLACDAYSGFSTFVDEKCKPNLIKQAFNSTDSLFNPLIPFNLFFLSPHSQMFWTDTLPQSESEIFFAFNPGRKGDEAVCLNSAHRVQGNCSHR